jgi:Spy/CpxP family protein refolding chaperone
MRFMKILLATTTAGLILLGTTTAHADDPPADPPRTHVDTTVVDSSASSNPSGAPARAIGDNTHQFEAGAPDIVKVTQRLHLNRQQQSQLNDAIERADAGAAVLIKREHDVREMLAATTPDDPLYAKLVADETEDVSKWNENREGLRQDVLALLTPAQRKRFEELSAQR